MDIWRLTTMNLQELIRRLRAGETRAAISRAMNMSVNTVKDYRRWAQAQGLLEGPLPDPSASLRAGSGNAWGAASTNVSSLSSTPSQ